MGNYYDGRKNTNGNPAIRIFLLTLSMILVVGIPSLFVAKRIKDADKAGEVKIVSVWEKIPEAGVAENAAVTSDDQIQKAVEIDTGDEENTNIIATTADDTITIGFAGDILFDNNYAVGNAFRNAGNSAEGVVGQTLLEKMRAADIMMVNNEFPYSYRGTPTEGKTYTFRAKPETVSILNEMGVDIVGLANNHAYDYGEEALVDSFSILKDAGVEYVGAGNNIEEASRPFYYVTNSGMKIAIICATQIERLDNPDTKGATETTPGVFRCLNDALLLEKVKEARAENAYVIVFIHWGTESTQELDYLQTDQAKEIVNAGANLIIGAHPHVLQKIDYVNGVPVVYSLGNYIFNSKTQDTGMILMTLHTSGSVNLQFVPAIQSGCSVYEAIGEERMRILNEMAAMSPGITLDSNGYISPR